MHLDPDHFEAHQGLTRLNEIAAALGTLGFRRSLGQAYCTHVDRVHHVVWLKKDKLLGGTQVCVYVHHTCFAPGTPWYLSPIGGELSPRGVVESHSWAPGCSTESIPQLLAAFFAAFRAEQDVVNSIAGIYVYPRFQAAVEQLATGQGSLAPMADRGGSPLYAVPGGARSAELSATLLGQVFRPLAMRLGLTVSHQSPLLAVRERQPGVFDCVRVLPDKFSTVIAVEVFNWVRDVWAVEKHFRGEFHPFNGRLVEVGGHTLWAPALTASVTELDDWYGPISDALASASQVGNCAEYAATLDTGYTWLRERLLRRASGRSA